MRVEELAKRTRFRNLLGNHNCCIVKGHCAVIMSKKYVPPHLRGKSTDLSTSSLSSLTKAASSPRNSTDRSKSSSLSAASAPSRDKEVIFFGDSFIRMFTLVKNRDIRVEAFKGASAKGLTRDGNQNRDKIIGLVQKVRPKRVIFCFGRYDRMKCGVIC